MRHFILIALSVSALGNRVLHIENNETYPENSWEPGRADELVKKGFLREVPDPTPIQNPLDNQSPEAGNTSGNDNSETDLNKDDSNENPAETDLNENSDADKNSNENPLDNQSPEGKKKGRGK